MGARPEIHILNPMENAFGGSERRALALADLLQKDADVRIWSTGKPDPRLGAGGRITSIDVSQLRFPRSGVLVLVGCYFEIPTWVSVMRPKRLILVYNIPWIEHLAHAAYVLKAFGHSQIEVITAGRALEPHVKEVGLELAGTEPSWIDLDRFRPAVNTPKRPFTVGRLSRDVREKFHSEDAALFRRVAESGARVRIMGGTCLAPALDGCSGIEVLEAGAVSAASFLRGLDALVYRTSEAWTEAWGRVVAEAMACGLPVVVDRRIGIVEILESGKDSLLFSDSAEAERHIAALKEDKSLRSRLGSEARLTVERHLGEAARQKWIEMYTKDVAARV